MFLLNLLASIFPKVCCSCHASLEGGSNGRSPNRILCAKCESYIRLKLAARCMVCNQDLTHCKLCRDLPQRPLLSWIFTALEDNPYARQLVKRAYSGPGWRLHQPLAQLMWARYLVGLTRPPTRIIALPSRKGDFWLSSGDNSPLASYLSRQMGCSWLSWRRGLLYRVKKGDRLLLVGWSYSLDALLNDLAYKKWQEADEIGALLALMMPLEANRQ